MHTGYSPEQLVSDSRQNATPKIDRERVKSILNNEFMRRHALWVFSDMLGRSRSSLEEMDTTTILNEFFADVPSQPKQYIVSETGRTVEDLIIMLAKAVESKRS